MWKLLFLAISLAGVFCAEDQHYQTTSKAPPAQQPSASQYPQQAPQAGAKPGVKDVTAGGRYYDGGEHGHDHHGYNHGHRIFRGFDVPLIDDYICDLDATILVVTNTDTPNTLFQAQVQDSPQGAPVQDAAPVDNSYNRAKRSAYIPPEYGPGRENYGPAKEYSPPREYYGRDKYDHDHDGYAPPAREFGHKYDHDFEPQYHGHGPGVVANADRLRCSVIAGNDEDSCTACCRLSARRDRSISKEKIIGFLVDNNQLNYDAQAHGGEGYSDNYGDRKKRSGAPVYSQGQAASAPIEIPTPEADNRCVCCAPKRYRPFIFDRFFRRQHHRYNHHDGYAGPY